MEKYTTINLGFCLLLGLPAFVGASSGWAAGELDKKSPRSACLGAGGACFWSGFLMSLASALYVLVTISSGNGSGMMSNGIAGVLGFGLFLVMGSLASTLWGFSAALGALIGGFHSARASALLSALSAIAGPMVFLWLRY